MKRKDYFPIFIDINDKEILVFGGGNIATRRIKTLLTFGPKITVIAKTVSEDLMEMEKEGIIKIGLKEYEPSDIVNCLFVLAATDNETINDSIYYQCKEKGIMVNCSHQKEKCDFFFPSIIKEEEYVIGITSSGSNHRGVKEFAKMISSRLKGDKQ